jgi:propionyl-CoA synthetase
VIVSTSCGIDGAKSIPYKPLLDEAILLASVEHHVDKVIILQRPEVPSVVAKMRRGRDLDWHEETAKVTAAQADAVACVEMDASDPSYILYTSGTTGKPKGVVRDTAGHCVALKWAMQNVYGVSREDVFWAASDVGW